METSNPIRQGILATLLTLPLHAAEPALRLEFGGGNDEPKWVAQNDGVMGGLSKGDPEIKDGLLVFSGTLSLENNGGFSQIHTKGGKYDLSSAKGFKLRVKGDGRTYQLRLATDALHRGSNIAYTAGFETTADEWVEVFVPFAEMKPTWRGTDLDGPPLDLSNVGEIAILIGDKKSGGFLVKFDWMEATGK